MALTFNADTHGVKLAAGIVFQAGNSLEGGIPLRNFLEFIQFSLGIQSGCTLFGHQRYDIRKLCKGKETHQIQQEKRLVKYALRKPPSNSPNPPARQPSFRLTPYMFVFRVNPRPGNRIPHSGILSFSLAVGTTPCSSCLLQQLT